MVKKQLQSSLWYCLKKEANRWMVQERRCFRPLKKNKKTGKVLKVDRNRKQVFLSQNNCMESWWEKALIGLSSGEDCPPVRQMLRGFQRGGHKTMFILGWLPRVITVDSRLINFTKGPISCIASDASQQLQKGDFTHRSCLRSPGLGRKQPFWFHCSSPQDPDIYKSNSAVLATALAFFNGTLFIFYYQLPWQIWNNKFSCMLFVTSCYTSPCYTPHGASSEGFADYQQ